MQVVGAHTLEEHRKTKGVIQYCNCIMASYTIIVNAEQIPTHIQGQRSPPTMLKMKRVRQKNLDNYEYSEGIKSKNITLMIISQ